MPRELYVERLVSQNRNYTTSMTLDGVTIGSGSSINLLVGGTYTFKLYGGTATQGYNQFEAFINFPNSNFQVLSVSTSYTSDNSPYVPNPNSQPYADACLWQNDPNSPNYRSCTGGDYKAGGTVFSTYVVKVLSGAGSNVPINTLLYDFSGSSYHYNADYTVARIASVVDPTNAGISKSFSPSTTTVNGVSALTITLTNPNSTSISGYNFTDNLPAGMTVANPPAAATTGWGSPVFAPTAGATSLSFTNGTLAANGSCVIVVNVTASNAAAYTNTTQHLFVGALDTGKTASASLTVSNTPAPPACTSGWTLPKWTFAGFTTNPPPYPTANTLASDVATAAISVGGTSPGTLTALADANNGSAASPSMLLYGWAKNGPIDTATYPYVQFAIDTSKYTSVQMQLNASQKANGPNNDAVYYSTNGTTWIPVSTFNSTTSWATYGPYSISGASTTGVTYFRIYGYGAANNSVGQDMNLDDVIFTG